MLTRLEFPVSCASLCHLDVSVEKMRSVICCYDQSNEESFFTGPQFGSQVTLFHLLGFIKPVRHFNLNAFLYDPFKMFSQH